jgi:hypothetical protein
VVESLLVVRRVLANADVFRAGYHDPLCDDVRRDFVSHCALGNHLSTPRRGGSAGTGTMACCGTGLGSSIQCVTTQDTKNGSQLRTDGHSAFDESRAETLRRLEQEQVEFQEFVDHLRMAKDKAEFDQFITERRTMPSAHECAVWGMTEPIELQWNE